MEGDIFTAKASSHSNRTQLNILFDFMENNEDLAKGFANTENGRAKLQRLWQSLVEKLNANGPPIRTLNEWKRVWTVHKYRVKKKLIKNKKSIVKTGGGPCEIEYITPEDESVINACGFEATISGIEGVKTFGSGNNSFIEDASNTFIAEESPSASLPYESPPALPTKSPTFTTRSSVNVTTTTNTKNSLLEKQLKIQEEHLEVVKKSYVEQVRFNNEIIQIAQQLVKSGEEDKELKRKELNLKKLELDIKQNENVIQRRKLNYD